MSEATPNRPAKRGASTAKKQGTTGPTLKPRVLRLPEACNYIGVSRTQIYRLKDAGKLVFLKIGDKAVAVTVESLDALIDNSPVA